MEGADKKIGAVVAACQDAVSHHAAELTACFDEFDEDGGGIDIREFNKMCDAVIGKDLLTMDERISLFHHIEADVDGEHDEREDEIENGALFADAILKMASSPLATPAACRNYWASERQFDPIT